MKPLRRAGLVLGLGFGGFLDGIVLHQILGWHHLICTTDTCQVETVAEFRRQNSEDGFFHLATWLLTVAGTAVLFRAARADATAQGRALFGALLAGWGLFNLVEGLIDHHLLQIHHVRPGHPQQTLFDLAFLGSGVVLLLVGILLARDRHNSPRPPLPRRVDPTKNPRP